MALKPLSSDLTYNPVIIEKIKNGDTKQLANIYKAHRFEFITWITNQYSCSNDEAKDLYQMAIITLYDNIKSNRLNKLNSSIKTYLFAIGKNKILEQRKSSYRFVKQSDHEVLDVPEIGRWENDDYEARLQMVEDCLHNLGEPCRTLLELYYFHNMTMEEIAKRLQHKNTDTSKNVKYKCLRRLRKIYHTEFVRTNRKNDEE